MYWIVGTVVTAMLCVCFFSFKKGLDGDKKNKEYEVLIKKQKEYYDGIVRQDGEIRKFRHDIKTQLYCLKRLLEDGNIRGGMQYLRDIVEDYEGMGLKRETGNYILDLVVEDIIKEKDGIILEWNGQFPENTKMKDTDLCSLFANILKNAKEEVRDMAEKRITVTVKLQGGAVFVTCRNLKGRGRRREKGNRERGWGLAKVKDIVKRYGGELKIEDCRGEYVVKILLYNML